MRGILDFSPLVKENPEGKNIVPLGQQEIKFEGSSNRVQKMGLSISLRNL
jgi:hypothetical protein